MNILIAVWTDSSKKEFFGTMLTDSSLSTRVVQINERHEIGDIEQIIIYDPIAHSVQVRSRVKIDPFTGRVEEVSRTEPLGHMLVIGNISLGHRRISPHDFT